MCVCVYYIMQADEKATTDGLKKCLCMFYIREFLPSCSRVSVHFYVSLINCREDEIFLPGVVLKKCYGLPANTPRAIIHL